MKESYASYAMITLSDARCLAAVVTCLDGNRNVARKFGGHVYIGEAHGILNEQGQYAGENVDVRHLYLRVDLDNATTVFWSVRDLMADYSLGRFTPHYEVPAVL